jgi:diguanylate cyclase (GGDEF)-like protein
VKVSDFINKIIGTHQKYEDKLYLYIVVAATIMSGFILIPMNLIFEINPINTLMLVLQFLLSLTLFILFRYKNILLPLTLVGLSQILVFITWFTSGGEHGGSNVYIILVFLIGVVLLRKWKRLIFVIGSFLGVVIIFTMAYINPDLVVSYPSTSDAWFDITASSIICYAAFYLSFNYLINSYKFERSLIRGDIKGLLKLSSTDELTKLFNRRYFNQILKDAFQDMKYKRSIAAMIIFDIDFFKKVNDTHGHNIGDEVLASIAATAKKLVRKTDVLARWGGEEFVLFLPETTKKDAAKLCEKIRLGISGITHSSLNLSITISMGYTEWSPIDTTFSFIQRADSNLYEAKETGRNRAVGTR